MTVRSPDYTAASIGGTQTQRDAAPAFSPHRLAVLGVYVLVVAGLARRTESRSTIAATQDQIRCFQSWLRLTVFRISITRSHSGTS